MKKNNICLVGFMGAGKSTVAKDLAGILTKPYFVDNFIQATLNVDIFSISHNTTFPLKRK